MKLSVQETGLQELLKGLSNAAKNIPRELYTVLNKAGSKTKIAMAREVGQEITAKAKSIKEQIKIHKDRHNMAVTVSLYKSGRIPLRDFGAKNTKKGVTAKISKTAGKKIYPNSFIITKFGNHVFNRVGKERFPLLKPRGPSPWGVLVKNPEKITAIVIVSRVAVVRALSDRIRYLELKKSGGLNWQQSETTSEE